MAQLRNFGLDSDQVWDIGLALAQLRARGEANTKRTAERRLHEAGFWPPELSATQICDEQGRPANPVVLNAFVDRMRSKRKLLLFAQLKNLPDGKPCLHVNDARGTRYWLPLAAAPKNTNDILTTLHRVQQHLAKDIAIIPHGALVQWLRDAPSTAELAIATGIHAPVLDFGIDDSPRAATKTSHLKLLEAEAIHIIREAIAEADNPVMLHSIGKDSAVMLHLARKAFYPSPPPFPLLHVDTRWKFREMYSMRDYIAQHSSMDLLVHINPEAIEKDINPFDHGAALHTDIAETQALIQALDQHEFDMVFAGARRDEEKSRAKERIFSLRTANHRWDPTKQRPELWNLYNTQKKHGESIRVFPLSNWTELDIWQYIHQESIPVVPLYFARKRPVVVRDGLILMVDDHRFRLLPGEEIKEKMVRFRSLGCYPLTGAFESGAKNVPEIILELVNTRISERRGRAIDNDAAAGMEQKKQEGYF